MSCAERIQGSNWRLRANLAAFRASVTHPC